MKSLALTLVRNKTSLMITAVSMIWGDKLKLKCVNGKEISIW